jgi:Fur family transcriptional regulator, ferric uptake regulator
MGPTHSAVGRVNCVSDPEQLHQEVKARLQQADQLYTRGRQSIVDALAGAGVPLTLPALLDQAPTLTQSSAYRNLSLMEQAGVVRRLVHGTDHAHYELAEDLTGHHHHLICRQCGVIRDVTLDRQLERSLDVAFARIAVEAGFQQDTHDIDLYGTCADCA